MQHLDSEISPNAVESSNFPFYIMPWQQADTSLKVLSRLKGTQIAGV